MALLYHLFLLMIKRALESFPKYLCFYGHLAQNMIFVEVVKRKKFSYLAENCCSDAIGDVIIIDLEERVGEG